VDSDMTGKTRKDELERRLEQSRRLSKDVTDPTTHERLVELMNDLEKEKKDEEK
jgi:hypothetical protein